MSEKVANTKIERDYKKFLYFVDGEGNVCRKAKSGEGSNEIVVASAVKRDNQFLYFVDKDGDVSRSERASRAKKPASDAA